MFVVTRTPHEVLVSRLRAAGVEIGMIGPADDRGWLVADVEPPEPAEGGTRRTPADVAAALAAVDRVADAPWVVALDTWTDDLPDVVEGLLAARTAPGVEPVVARWSHPVFQDTTGTAPTAQDRRDVPDAADLVDDPADLLAALDALLGLRDDPATATETLLALDTVDRFPQVLDEITVLPVNDPPAPTAGVHVARTDPALVRAALRHGTRSWVRVPAERTSVVVHERLPVPPDAEPGDEAVAAVVAEHRVRTRLAGALRDGEAVLGLMRSGDATTWTLAVPGNDQRFGNWDTGWTFLDEQAGRDGAYDALVHAFGEPLQPVRLRALLDATTWDGDPAAELVHQLRLPDEALEALDDPDRFRHGAQEVVGLADGEGLAPADRAALEARAPRRTAGQVVRDVALLLAGTALALLGLGTFLTQGGLVGVEGEPWWTFPVGFAGAVLAFIGGGALLAARGRRRRFVDG
ncbi:hypothetical protein [Cellulosimicrobium marinum]|uniref:hypothetical protein n=1 Tax=Cellulosimicrobium marinum TaxID=1638992 RepID=UPI001E375074|nr:hypothetical protein [Cellulosimicrobium marinum]